MWPYGPSMGGEFGVGMAKASISLIGLVVAGAASAQIVPVPPPVPPAAVSPPTREEVNRGQPATPAPAPSRLTIDGGIERAPCPLADPRFAGVTITLTQARFDGLKGADPASLKPAYEAYIGRTIPLAAVCDMRDAAATILRRQGYLAAVQVPPQRIEGGVVRFDVLMAKLVGIQVRGAAGRSERAIAAYLDKLKNAEVFNEKEAERYLLLARDLPGFDVRLTLRPAGTVPGKVIGEVAVVRQPLSIDTNIQNYGARDVGRIGGLLRGEAYGLLGLGDRLSVGVFSTADFREQQVLQTSYDFRLGGEGLTVGTRFTYAWTKPDIGAGLNLRSRTLVAGGELRYPFVRAQAVNVRGAGGLDYVNQRVRFAGLPLTEDKLRVAYLRLDFDALDRASIGGEGGYSAAEPRWRAVGSLEARRGLDILGASRPCGAGFARCLVAGAVPPSRIEGDPTASVIRASGLVEFRATPRLAFVLVPSAQYSRSPLLSYEEISGGNYTFGRGYDPGVIIGDSGVGFQSELRLGGISPRRADALAFQPFAFFDFGRVWNRDRLTAGPDPQKLESAGGGLRVAFGDHLRLDTALAVPLRTTGLQTKRGSPRLLVSLTTRLVPWR